MAGAKRDDSSSSGGQDKCPGVEMARFGSKLSWSGLECIDFNAREPSGLIEVVSGRDDPARAKGDDDPSSGW